MALKDMLLVHADIDRQNKENVKRWKVKTLYTSLVRGGQFSEAREILRLLRRGYLKMYLDDVSWNVQTALEGIGFPVRYSRNGVTSEARM